MIEHLELGPAWVAGNSFGASITLRLAGERANLLRGIIAHEPPLFSLLANDPSVALTLDEVGKRIGAVVERIASGDNAGAARQFVETVALGPGTCDQLSPDLKETFITNAPTFLDEAHDPEQLAFDLAWIGAFHRPSLRKTGDQSPPTFAPVVEKLANVLPNASVATFPGAGRIPHVTHPTHMSKRSWLSSARTRLMVQQSRARPEVDVGRMTDPRGCAMAFAARSMTRETPLNEKAIVRGLRYAGLKTPRNMEVYRITLRDISKRLIR